MIFFLLALSTITDTSFDYWGLGLVAAGLALQSAPPPIGARNNG